MIASAQARVRAAAPAQAARGQPAACRDGPRPSARAPPTIDTKGATHGAVENPVTTFTTPPDPRLIATSGSPAAAPPITPSVAPPIAPLGRASGAAQRHP